MSLPVSPTAALKAYAARIPGEYFEAFNACIHGYMEGRSSYVPKSEILSRLANAGYSTPWFQPVGGVANILEVYRAEGWLVEVVDFDGRTYYHFKIPCVTTDYVSEKDLPMKNKLG
ncbi:MAG: hypothetical protein UZ21_OP11001000262 [Microgenomates bacterium OLB22]|nr:MAG: hypothetical protein UZ21_OP11001000262 [Microgenomates bacterium OLB22]